ncbi:MAG: hypothetical protein ACN4E2_01300 [Nitrospinota bacterium]
MFKNISSRAWLIVLLSLFVTACSSSPVLKAFRGKFTEEKREAVIVEYCQSCHIHKDFEPVGHIFRITLKYDQPLFANAKECRVCHTVKKNFWNDIIRKTHLPTGHIVNQ